MATVRAPRHRRPTSKEIDVAPAPVDRWGLRIPASALTLAGFRAWATSDDFPEHIRVAFLDEEIHIDMSNEELETHNKVKMEIARVLLNWNREARRGTFGGDGVLISNAAAGVSNNPDAFFFTHDSLQAGRVRLVPRVGEQGQYIEIEGTPDWVLEVVSDSSVQKDTTRLREAYHRAGIAEYWLIDARGDDIRFQILHRRKTGYAAAPVRDGWQRSRVFGRSFRLDRQRDALGLWEYTLHVQTDG
jgi:Uma2 family endonuclease